MDDDVSYLHHLKISGWKLYTYSKRKSSSVHWRILADSTLAK
jgi:hypothetical protein